MRNIKPILAGLILIMSLPALALGAHFLEDPTLTPDGAKVIFSYDSDLWIVPTTGGTAYRITGMDGNENRPRVSPDGKWLAFTGTESGDANVYVMPLNGGEIRQLSYNDGRDFVTSWSWDSKYVYFTSTRFNNFTGLKVSIDGGTPIRIFKNFFNTTHDLFESPVDDSIYFTESWESFRFATRKRYKGAYNPDIKSYNLKTGDFKVYTTWEGKDFQPNLDKKGNLYFISDEANSEYNLYTLKDGKKTRLTDFDKSILNIQVSADGSKIVFEKDYQIYVYDVAGKKAELLDVKIYDNEHLAIPADFNVASKISYFDVSPDGKKLAFVSRGELFVSDIKGKFIRKLDTSPMGRVSEVAWLKDNQTILFNQTVEGWNNLFTIKADGSGKEKQITNDKANNREISLNPELTTAVYISGRNEIRLLDLKTWKSEVITKDELWGFYNATPQFSPDGRYVAYTVFRNFEKDIVLYDTKDKKSINITKSGVTEDSPYWSPDGKYLYFASDRYNPVYPLGDRNTKIYRLPLVKVNDMFRSDEFDKLFKEEKKKDKKDKKEKKNEKKTPAVKIDFDDMAKRWEIVSPRFGQQFSPYVIRSKDSTIVLYLSNHGGGKYELWKTVYEPFEKTKTEKIAGSEVRGTYQFDSVKDKHYMLINGNINELNISGKKLKPIKMSYQFQRNMKDEFNQMFYELWANMQENYYDENFHGVDWVKIRDYYVTFLPFVRTRDNLRTLNNDMLGELNSSHQGFYSNGDEEKTFHKMYTAQSGIVWDNEKPYVVDRVIDGSPVDKESIDIKSGDVLIAVNGEKCKPVVNRESYFTSPERGGEFTLRFKRDSKEFDVKIKPFSNGGVYYGLYEEWIENNQKRVDKLSNKRIAYIHMKDMVQGELNNFIMEMSTEWYSRDALILDLRYNRGGNVHDAVLNFLSQRPYTKWKYRGGKFAPQPNFAPASKPIVVLINEQSLSDAEMTSAGFKELGIGKLIGTETYRWLIFTSGKGLVDGSFYRLPSWGCYTLDGKDIEMHGVAPDIEVDNTFEDRQEGRDPQLERAVKEIMKQLK